MKIAIINGPNLNLLGQREPGIYGQQGFDDYLSQLKLVFPEIELVYYQSNIEGELVTALQDFAQSCRVYPYFCCHRRCGCGYPHSGCGSSY